MLLLSNILLTAWLSTAKGEEKTCSPPYILNGIYTPHRIIHKSDDEIRYECNYGFYPVTGSTVSKCTPTGWIPVPRCTLKPCEFPQFKYGRLYYEESLRPNFPVSIGNKYSYKCDNGFSPPSGYSWDYLRCTAQGWEPEVPCVRKCVFHYVENGDSTYWEKIYVQGQSLKVQCYNGYSLQNGQDTMTCTENGWSPPPKCIRINSTRTCGPPPPIDNGDITSLSLPVYEPLSSVEYQCQKYYLLKGKKTITCRNGKWSEPPTCLHACVIPENIMESHNIILKWRHTEKIYSHSGEDIEFGCKYGYYKARDSPPFRTKCINGTINYPTCV